MTVIFALKITAIIIDVLILLVEAVNQLHR